MGKLIFWFVVAFGLLLVARLLAHAAHKRQAPPPPQRPAPAPSSGSAMPESMVRCARCGIHLPRSEAVMIQGRTWCSTEHARLGPP